MSDETPTSDNPEVQKAMDARDEMLAEVKKAIRNVDRLIQEYAEAERKR